MGMKIIGLLIVVAIAAVCFLVMSKFYQEEEKCQDQKRCDGNCASCAQAMNERYMQSKKENIHEDR